MSAADRRGEPPASAPGAEPPDLATTQTLFWKLIAAPEGVRPGMDDLRRRGRLAAQDLSFMIRGDERLAAEDRLDIYASMYFYRLRDGLAEDFPKVAAVVGGAAFHNLVTDFLLAHPPRHWSLRYLGEPFADFLENHALCRQRGDLADLARLEWARIEMFDAADADLLTRELAATAGADLSLSLITAACLLPLQWNVAPVWRHLEDAGVAGTQGSHSAAVETAEDEFAPPAQVPEAEEAPVTLLVWRRAFRVLHRSVSPGEAACLRSLAAGRVALPDLCEMLMEQRQEGGQEAASQDEITRDIAGLMGRWLADGLLQV